MARTCMEVVRGATTVRRRVGGLGFGLTLDTLGLAATLPLNCVEAERILAAEAVVNGIATLPTGALTPDAMLACSWTYSARLVSSMDRVTIVVALTLTRPTAA
jgi:hypothetical protein